MQLHVNKQSCDYIFEKKIKIPYIKVENKGYKYNINLAISL